MYRREEEKKTWEFSVFLIDGIKLRNKHFSTAGKFWRGGFGLFSFPSILTVFINSITFFWRMCSWRIEFFFSTLKTNNQDGRKKISWTTAKGSWNYQLNVYTEMGQCLHSNEERKREREAERKSLFEYISLYHVRFVVCVYHFMRAFDFRDDAPFGRLSPFWINSQCTSSALLLIYFLFPEWTVCKTDA